MATMPPGSGGRIRLADLPDRIASSHPDRVAVESSTGERLTYGELTSAAERIGAALRDRGIGPGARVGLYASKTPDTVAALFGILKSGAAYVAMDPQAPPLRIRFIASDCDVRAVIAEPERLARLSLEGPELRLGAPEGVGGLALATRDSGRGEDAEASRDLAYLLYTSGSTGSPKGVMITEANAMSFVDWCRETFDVGETDRFSSHAPFHFDLSVFDLFVCFRSGGTLFLVNSILARLPTHLAGFASERRITVWYSTPSALTLLHTSGALQRYDLSSIHTVLFAGEVFPLKHLREVRRALPGARMFNLYGPTETNVCTWFEVPRIIDEHRTEPFPIGKPCSHVRTAVLAESGSPAAPEEEGELLVTGASVMEGYWNRPEATRRAWHVDVDGTRWYRTGDFVREDAAGDYVFLGRRDRMVKRRGYRIELGEVEAILYRHPKVAEAAVIARELDGQPVIEGFVECANLATGELEAFCGTHLPAYMIPDAFVVVDTLPRTSTGKTDYQRLQRLGTARHAPTASDGAAARDP